MDIAMEHFKEFYLYYLIAVAVLAPIVFFTRKYSLPLIFYTLETSIYLVIMHIVMHALVGMTAWFKTNSSMKALRADGVPVDAVEWHTPLLSFWVKEDFDPQWVFTVEIVFAVIIVLLVLRLRPPKLAHEKKKREFANEGAQKTGEPVTAKDYAERAKKIMAAQRKAELNKKGRN